MDEYGCLVVGFTDIYWENNNSWSRRWDDSCYIMTAKTERENDLQQVITRKATKEEIEKWNAELNKRNPFKLG